MSGGAAGKTHSRGESGDTGIEVLAIVLALFMMLSLAAAVVVHSRSAAAVHDAARQAGYGALADVSGSIAGDATGAAGAVQANLERVWREQLQWLAEQGHSAALENCRHSGNLSNVRVESVGLQDAGGTVSDKAVMLSFDYECSIRGPLLLDSFTMTIGGSWSEIAPWL